MNSFFFIKTILPGCGNINKTEYHKVFIGERRKKKSYDTRGFCVVFFFVFSCTPRDCWINNCERQQQKNKHPCHFHHPVGKFVYCRKLQRNIDLTSLSCLLRFNIHISRKRDCNIISELIILHMCHMFLSHFSKAFLAKRKFWSFFFFFF